MAKSHTLASARQFALCFTMTMAIITLLAWVGTGFSDNPTGWLGTVQTIGIWLTCIGGVLMGVLYLVYVLRRK